MKFWKTTIAALVLLIFLLAALIYQSLDIQEEDRKSYEKIMESKKVKNEENYTAQQLRKGTVKTLLLNQGEERKVGYLSAESSTLFFSKENTSSQLIEEMQNVHLTYQEDLYVDKEGQPYQTLLHLDAKNAVYYYSEEKFMADQVNLTRYRIPTHEFVPHATPGTPFFKGRADQVVFSFGQSKPALQAKNLKASLE